MSEQAPKPKSLKQEGNIRNLAISGFAALGALIGDPGSAEANELRALTTIPEVCVKESTGKESDRACASALVQNLKRLARYIADVKNIKKDTPLFNPSVAASKQCTSVAQWLETEKQNLEQVAKYLTTYHMEWVAQKARELEKKPEDLDVGKAIKNTKATLGGCGFIVTVGWALLSGKGESLARQRAPALGEAIAILAADFDDVRIQEKQETDLLGAIEALLKALSAGAR